MPSTGICILTDRIYHGVNRHIERYHDGADDDAQESYHEWFDHSSHTFDGIVDFMFIGFGHFHEHSVERAGLLADRDHVYGQGREDGVIPHRLGDCVPVADGHLYFRNSPGYHPVSGGLTYDGGNRPANPVLDGAGRAAKGGMG